MGKTLCRQALMSSLVDNLFIVHGIHAVVRPINFHYTEKKAKRRMDMTKGGRLGDFYAEMDFYADYMGILCAIIIEDFGASENFFILLNFHRCNGTTSLK